MSSITAAKPDWDMWDQYASLAATYYVAARFAALAGYTPLCGNLMHHAIELLLKCGLIKAGAIPGGAKAPLSARVRFRGLRLLARMGLIEAPSTVNEVDLFLRRRFGHRLKKLWKDFKKSHQATDLFNYNAVISSLDRWEEIRYPKRGVLMHVEFVVSDPPLPPPSGPAMQGIRSYQVNFKNLDQCFQELWSICGLTTGWFRTRINVDWKAIAKSAYEELNEHRIYS